MCGTCWRYFLGGDESFDFSRPDGTCNILTHECIFCEDNSVVSLLSAVAHVCRLSHPLPLAPSAVAEATRLYDK